MPLSDDSIQTLIDRFWETVPPSWNAVRSNLRAAAAEHFGISVEQFHTLRHIRKGACSISALAKVQQVSRPAVSQAVDGLVSKGLVERQPDSIDRRCVHLALTPAGDELLNAIFQRNRVWMADRFAALSPQEAQSLLKALELLKNVFE